MKTQASRRASATARKLPHTRAQKPQEPAAEEEAAEQPIFLIQADPELSAGYINGRFDVVLRGRIAGLEPAVEACLVAGGAVTARAQFARAHAGPEVSLPDGRKVLQQAFQFSIAWAPAGAPAATNLSVQVRSADGRQSAQDFTLRVDPGEPRRTAILAGPLLQQGDATRLRPPLILYGERVVLDPEGMLHVQGWAIAHSPITTVQVFAGDVRLRAAQTGIERDDVAGFYGGYRDARRSGFALTTPLPPGLRGAANMRVQAITLDGLSHETWVPVERTATRLLLASPAQTETPEPLPSASPSAAEAVASAPEEPHRQIHFCCDDILLSPAGQVIVNGWVVSGVGTAPPEVFLGAERLGEAELGYQRADVGEAFAHVPLARFGGFRFVGRVAEPGEGPQCIRVIFRNGMNDVRELERFVVAAALPVAAAAVEPQQVAEMPEDFRFELDNPRVVNGAAAAVITGRLTIEGWALARAGVTGVDVLLDGKQLGKAHYGLARQDVGAALPGWDDSVRSGYAFHSPLHALRDGAHMVQLVVNARNGSRYTHSFRIQVTRTEDDECATICRRMPRMEANAYAGVIAELGHAPRFLLLVRPQRQLDTARLGMTLRSLRSQAYGSWRAVILAEAGQATALRKLLQQPPLDDRVSVAALGDKALSRLVAGQDRALLIGWLCAGDELGCDALAEMAVAAGLRREAEFLYADEARRSPASGKKEPFFKPDFSPDLLLSTNYIGRPWCARPALLRRCGITPSGLEKMGEHHVVLRCTEQAKSVYHVPKLLCSRGVDALDSKEASVIALTLAAERGGVEAEVLPGAVPGTWRLKRTQVAQGKVSIIIPTCAAHGHIETCIKTLRGRTAYRNFEIICIDNIPAEHAEWKAWVAANADRVAELPETFNWSRFNNQALELADGDFLLFLNDDIEVTHEGWLDALLEHAQRPEVGVVGPQLLYPDGKVQHAGMFLAGPGIGRHAFRFAAADDPGYFGLALTQRNVIAVTGACMLVRRSLFEELGGFDEAHEVVNNDLDFCLRVHRAGKLTIYTPYASLIHHELASRDRLANTCDLSHFESRWKTLFAAGDPYFSPLLSRESDDYRPDNEPVQTVYAGHPLFKRQEIRRILVVKLDHIGDFITALPAVRRLKRLFPGASISVLAAPASRTLAAVEPAIDEFLDFEFFHARSSLGKKELGRDDWAALEQRLGAYGFDLAVDLRKQPDTREVLKHTRAHHLAGFDFLGQFPFLDISLEWEGDRVLHRKRSHVADDLMTLVAAIEVACEPDRRRLTFPIRERSLGFLPGEARELFGRTVVAVHPGVGNEMRRWPPEHFATLVDLLVERNGVNVVLIGGPDEAELADQVMAQIQQRKGVTSCAGKTSLRDLPVLLSSCALYIGNNSGPKHIAAALGVPTIGIHSGVVDAVEWGPLGERAVALRRNMSCSPCYLARAEDCSRALACLRLLDPAAVHRTAEMLLARPLTRLPEVAPGQTAVRLQRQPGRAARGGVSAGSLASLAARAAGS